RKTAIFDAVKKGVDLFQSADPTKIASALSSERRIIILISDGLENASLLSSANVIREAVKNGISIYVIHLPAFVPDEGHLRPRRPVKGFKELAEETGGHFFIFGDAAMALDPRAEYDLSKIFAAIDDDLKGQYVLGFYPKETESFSGTGKSEVRLTVPSNRKLRVKRLTGT
ncbi:MAG: vWA domain-containing protein, partial [Pyrinomonadaceae bacterium]